MPAGGNWKEMFNAACEGDIELLRYHVDSGVDIDYAHPEFLSTPLVACILARQQASAELLIERGANIHLRSEFDEGMTPLQAARSVGLHALEARLLALGATATLDVAAAASTRAASAGKRGWWRTWLG
ncbi:ankyrin repeat domain-containing protein [Roseateles sp.]|jgi:ankyrin repeat protein|uniref:ankyrin repeat domain-containing protein n=1 Tax=Roseateles sp. TaxID=1971397 RepID=UPI0037CC9F2B